MLPWSKTQLLEERWWGNCVNTLAEQVKQKLYVEKMGLTYDFSQGQYCIPMHGKHVLDIGGGPVSILLMCHDVKGVVADPLRYPHWVTQRYWTAGIKTQKTKGEDLKETGFDEVWMYNLLQHVDDPEKVVNNARRAGNILRVFDWLNIPIIGPHRHFLDRSTLDRLLGEGGTSENVLIDGWDATCYYGVFS